MVEELEPMHIQFELIAHRPAIANLHDMRLKAEVIPLGMDGVILRPAVRIGDRRVRQVIDRRRKRLKVFQISGTNLLCRIHHFNPLVHSSDYEPECSLLY